MQIRLLPCENRIPEWTLVQLQGSIIAIKDPSFEGDSKNRDVSCEETFPLSSQMGTGLHCLDGRTLGSFSWYSQPESPSSPGQSKSVKPRRARLVIGHKLLEGELVPLERPFIVVDKSTLSANHIEKTALVNADSAAAMQPSGQQQPGPIIETRLIDGQRSTFNIHRMDLVAVIRHKIVFKERPKPIVRSMLSPMAN